MKSKYPISDHFDGLKFCNPSGATPKKFIEVLRWQLSKQAKKWPRRVENKMRPQVISSSAPNEFQLTFINHVTFLIQCNGLNFLTDPVFSLRASPSQFAGPKRVREPGISLEALPKIDVVLVSHNHYDHMDIASLQFLHRRDRPAILAPLGNAQILMDNGITGVTESDWWDRTTLSAGTEVTTVPAQHWAARGLFDRNRALWSGFVISAPKRTLYFAGDTGYSDHFKQISSRLGPIDIALLPIGAYEPRWFMKDQHMNPADAVQAHLDLQSRLSIGAHFGTFQLTDEGIDDPVKDLEAAKAAAGVANFTVMEVGESRKL